MAEAIKTFNQKNIKVKDGVINRRADNGFNAVIDLFAEVLGDRCIGIEKDLLRKKLLFDGFHYVKELDLKYVVENRLWERSFNLIMKSEIPTNESFREVGDCRFEINSKGVFGTKSLTWNCVKGSLSEQEESRYLERLNHRLIIDRVKALDLTHLCLEHYSGSDEWNITCQSMIGSTTWVLIPPIFQTIKPKPYEIVKFMEFLELTADAVVNNAK